MEFLEKNSTRSFRLLFIYSNICDKDHYDDPQIRLAEVLLIQAPSKTDSLLAFRMTMLKLWNYSIPKELATGKVRFRMYKNKGFYSLNYN